MYQEQTYIHNIIVHEHIKGISMVLKCHGEKQLGKKNLNEVPDVSDNEKRVEKLFYAKQIFPFNYATLYILPITKIKS